MIEDQAARFDHTYDLYRNCILNELYYGQRLSFFSAVGFWLEIIIVMGSGASGVSGWIIWTSYPALKGLWAVIAAASTLLAALKPALQVDTWIKRYSALFSAYRQLAISMKILVEDIHEAGTISKDADKEINRIRARYRTLAVDDDPRPSQRVVQRLQAEVNRRVPPESLFYPLLSANPDTRGDIGITVAGDANGMNVKVEPVDPWPREEEA